MENERALKIAENLTPEDVKRIEQELSECPEGVGKLRRELILKIYKALQDEKKYRRSVCKLHAGEISQQKNFS